jgi:hypothetical protein
MKYSKSKRFFIGTPKGFGYAIVDKGDGNKGVDKIVFHTSDKEQVKEVFQNIEETHTDFPEPKTDWEPRLLMFKDNYFTSHYLVKSP